MVGKVTVVGPPEAVEWVPTFGGHAVPEHPPRKVGHQDTPRPHLLRGRWERPLARLQLLGQANPLLQVQHELLLLPQGPRLFGRVLTLVTDGKSPHLRAAAEQLLHLVGLVGAGFNAPVGVCDLEGPSVSPSDRQVALHRLRVKVRASLLPMVAWLLLREPEQREPNGDVLPALEAVAFAQLEQLHLGAHAVNFTEPRFGKRGCAECAHAKVLPLPRTRVAQADADTLSKHLHAPMTGGAGEHPRDVDQPRCLAHLPLVAEEQPLLLGQSQENPLQGGATQVPHGVAKVLQYLQEGAGARAGPPLAWEQLPL